MTRTLSTVAAELAATVNADAITSALIPSNVKTALALAVELAQGVAALEDRVAALEGKAA